MVALALALAACVGSPVVERAYEDRSTEGRYVEPAAYAAFLRGVLAEASGGPKEALDAYEEAAGLDPHTPEIWTRIGAVRCRLDRADARADKAFSRALGLDPGHARAWTAKAECARSRGDDAGAREAASRAVALDPDADDANALLLEARLGRDPQARTALVALTLTAGDRVLAWETLARWAESSGDVTLRVRALGELARIEPARRDGAAHAAEKLAVAGDLVDARTLAAAVADAGSSPLPDGHPLAARLAVDEAIARGEAALVRARATRTRVSLEEAAARALLLGAAALAKEIASIVVLADPGALGARLVLAASEGRDLPGAARRVDAARAAAVSAAALVAFAAGLVYTVTPEEAKATLARIAHEPIVPGDAAVTQRAAALVASGTLDGGVLPASF